jgi:hypothetical protein
MHPLDGFFPAFFLSILFFASSAFAQDVSHNSTASGFSKYKAIAGKNILSRWISMN